MSLVMLMLVLPANPIPQVSPPALKRHERVEAMARNPPRPPNMMNQGLGQYTTVIGNLVRVDDAFIVLQVAQSESQLAVLRQLQFPEVKDPADWRDGVIYKDSLIRHLRVAPPEVLDCPECPGVSLTGPPAKSLQLFIDQVVEVRLARALSGAWVVTRLRLPLRP